MSYINVSKEEEKEFHTDTSSEFEGLNASLESEQKEIALENIKLAFEAEMFMVTERASKKENQLHGEIGRLVAENTTLRDIIQKLEGNNRQLEDYIDKRKPTCVLCLEKYDFEEDRIPRILSCGESFCTGCLKEESASEKFLNCPGCTQITLTNGAIDNLPINHAILFS